MKPSKLVLFLLFIALSSCDKTKAYEKFDKDFPKNRWLKTDVRSYDFTVEDESKNYNLVLSFTHVDDYQFESIPIQVAITKPDKSVEVKEINLKIKDAAGNQLGKCDGDYCDLYENILTGEKLPGGTYNVKITNKFQFDYVPNVIGLGIKLSMAK